MLTHFRNQYGLISAKMYMGNDSAIVQDNISYAYEDKFLKDKSTELKAKEHLSAYMKSKYNVIKEKNDTVSLQWAYGNLNSQRLLDICNSTFTYKKVMVI